jgi:predicted amidophosphoribosyltransferase
VSPEPSQPACANCGAALTDQATICHACTGRLTADLASTADLLAELDTTITRQARITAPAKGNGDKPLPYDVPA